MKHFLTLGIVATCGFAVDFHGQTTHRAGEGIYTIACDFPHPEEKTVEQDGSASQPFSHPYNPRQTGWHFRSFPLDFQQALRFIYGTEEPSAPPSPGVRSDDPFAATSSPDIFSIAMRYGSIRNDRYLVEGSQEFVESCFNLLKDGRFTRYWEGVFHSLGIMASVEPERVDYDRLIEAVERIEDSDLPEEIVLRALKAGYVAVSRFGIGKSESFLVPRMSRAFWEKKRGFEQSFYIPEGGGSLTTVTPRYYATRSFDLLGEENNAQRLKALLEKEGIEEDTVSALAVAVVDRSAALRRQEHNRDVEFYRVWKEENHDKKTLMVDENALSHEVADLEKKGVPGNLEELVIISKLRGIRIPSANFTAVPLPRVMSTLIVVSQQYDETGIDPLGVNFFLIDRNRGHRIPEVTTRLEATSLGEVLDEIGASVGTKYEIQGDVVLVTL